MKTKNKNILVILGSLLVGLLLGWIFFAVERDAHTEHAHTAEEGAETIWTCSMHPQIRQPEPGACPICGMDLVPLEEEEGSTDPDMYRMSENAMKLANISTMRVGQGEASRDLRLTGKVEVDERNAYTQATHIPGRIEELRVNFTGERVNRGQTLAVVYSPDLVTAQEELLQAAAIRESQPELFEASRQKLRNWRIGEGQIDRILENGAPIERFPITADVNGVVTDKMVDLGDYVERGMPIYEISDLSKVWVLFDLYESQMAWVQEGSKVEYTVKSLPGETFEGRISFVDPLLDSRTRVATARVEVENPNGRLKPGMFVSGRVSSTAAATGEGTLVVPKSAVLWTGKRSIVYLKEDTETGAGFRMREVTLGPSLGDAYVVEEGLQPGDEIVVNGTFTVDAAAQLAGKPSMMNPAISAKHEMQMEQEDIRAYLKSNAYDFREEASAAFREQLDRLVATYLELKDALVEGDEEKSSVYSERFLERLRQTDPENLSGEARAFWEEKQRFLTEHAELDQEAENFEERRENFIFLSEAMIKTLAAFGLKDREIYVDYCPMADSDKGAYWLSLEKNIRNPYFGDAMLTCGEVVEQIK